MEQRPEPDRGVRASDRPDAPDAASAPAPGVSEPDAGGAGHLDPDTGGRPGALSDPPPAAARVFGDQLGAAVRYAELLATAGVERGLLGPREVPRLWDRHLLNSAVLGELLQAGEVVYDVGSGAGLPGIPLALARPDVHVVLVEPLKRRAEFLDEAVALLGLANVAVRRGRAEELVAREGRSDSQGDPRQPDVVTARAVAPMARLAAWCLPLLGPGGRLLALKGTSAAEELHAAERELVRVGAERWDVVSLGTTVLDQPATVVRVWRSSRPVDARTVQQVLRRSRESGRAEVPSGSEGSPRQSDDAAGRTASRRSAGRRQPARPRRREGRLPDRPSSPDQGVSRSSTPTSSPAERERKGRGRGRDRGNDA